MLQNRSKIRYRTLQLLVNMSSIPRRFVEDPSHIRLQICPRRLAAHTAFNAWDGRLAQARHAAEARVRLDRHDAREDLTSTASFGSPSHDSSLFPRLTAVSTPIFATKYSFFCIFRDLQDYLAEFPKFW